MRLARFCNPTRLFRPILLLPIRSYISIEDDMFSDEPNINFEAMNRDDLPQCQKIKGRYYSKWTKETNKSFVDAMKWMVSRDPQKLKFSFERSEPELKVLPIDNAILSNTDKPHFTWLNHASCLFQMEGLYIISDPVWSDRCSPVSFMGPQRINQPTCPIEDLPIDVVIISHTHYDHFDIETASRIGNKPLWVVPAGVKDILATRNITNCVELSWWESIKVPSKLDSSRNVEIVFTPTKHWTSRTPMDKNTCLWGSFVMMSPSSKMFFTGDTAYCDVFKKIGELYGPIDLAAIPIGAYNPRWFMKDVHINPYEAVSIHKDLRAVQSVGIHWGTFPLTDEDIVEPALEAIRCRQLLGVGETQFFTMMNGETYVLGEVPSRTLEKDNKEMVEEYLAMPRNEENYPNLS